MVIAEFVIAIFFVNLRAEKKQKTRVKYNVQD